MEDLSAQKVKENRQGPENQNIIRISPINLLKILFYIVLVGGLGFFALNQGMKFFYGVHLLKAPCDLCSELNPGVKSCIENLNSARPSYWTPEGWTDPFNTSTSLNRGNLSS